MRNCAILVWGLVCLNADAADLDQRVATLETDVAGIKSSLAEIKGLLAEADKSKPSAVQCDCGCQSDFDCLCAKCPAGDLQWFRSPTEGCFNLYRGEKQLGHLDARGYFHPLDSNDHWGKAWEFQGCVAGQCYGRSCTPQGCATGACATGSCSAGSCGASAVSDDSGSSGRRRLLGRLRGRRGGSGCSSCGQ